MADYQTVNIDDIVDKGGQPDDGDYIFRLKDVKGKESKSGNPMVIVEFEVVEGDFEGFSIADFFVLTTGGKPFPLGIISLKKLLIAAEHPLEAGFPFPLDAEAVAAIVYERLSGVKLVGQAVTTKNKKDGKMYQRPVITGLAEESEYDDFDFGDGESEDVNG